MASSEFEVVAHHAHSVLEVDACASPLLRHMLPSYSVTLEAFTYFDFDFAPGLCDILESAQPPSPEDLLSCSLPSPTSTEWVVYLQFFCKDSSITYHIYCGSGTAATGADKRLSEYDAYLDRGGTSSTMPSNIVRLINEGYERVGSCILASADIPEDAIDFYYLRACILLLEGALTAKLWIFKASTMGSLSQSCLWDKSDLSYRGLCNHSSLSEVVPPRVLDVFNCPELQEDWREEQRELLLARKHTWNHSASGIQSRGQYKQSEKGKEQKKEWYKTEEGKAQKRRENISESGKRSQRTYKTSEKGKASDAKYAKSDKGKANQRRKDQKRSKGGSAPDIVCEGCPDNYTTKRSSHMKRHQKRCPAHT